MATTLNDTATELALVAARLASEPAHPHAVPWQTTLRHSLASTLTRGQDDLLARTLEQCRGSSAAFDIARRAGIAAVECPDVVFEGGRRRARLMLLPVHGLDGNGLRHGRVAKSDHWLQLRARLSEVASAAIFPSPYVAGPSATLRVVRPEAGMPITLLLADYLYHPEEFRALPPSAVLRSAQAPIDLSVGMAVSRGALLQSGAPGFAARESARGSGQLGYLLALGVLPVGSNCDTDLVPDARFGDATWLAETSALIAAVLERPADSVTVSALAGFHRALKVGEQQRRLLQFLRDVPLTLARSGVAVDSARVVAAVHANEVATEVRVSLCALGQSRPLLKSLHRCDDIPAAERVLAVIDQRMVAMGLGAIERAAGTLRLESGVADSDDLRRRRFPVPRVDSARTGTC